MKVGETQSVDWNAGKRYMCNESSLWRILMGPNTILFSLCSSRYTEYSSCYTHFDGIKFNFHPKQVSHYYNLRESANLYGQIFTKICYTIIEYSYYVQLNKKCVQENSENEIVYNVLS